MIYNIYGDLYECMLLDLKNDPCLLTTFCLPNPQYNWRMLTIIAANFHSVEQNFLGRAVSGFRSDDANPPSPPSPLGLSHRSLTSCLGDKITAVPYFE